MSLQKVVPAVKETLPHMLLNTLCSKGAPAVMETLPYLL